MSGKYLSLFAGWLCFSVVLQAQIHISGPQSGTLLDTTYIVDGDISVQAPDSLIILPGAIILFSGSYSFDIYGYLYAAGSETDSIFFQPESDTVSWGSVIFRTGSSHDSELSYCFMTGASASAINTYGTNLSITHCTIIANSANWGGGIYCSSADPVISSCVVANNWCVNNGGGIYCTHASPTISDCLVAGNSCNVEGGGSGRGGGGICANHSSSPIISGCTVSGNHSNENGGGISINDNSHAQVLECLIQNNSADSSGGGIFCNFYCNAVIEQCDILDNDALAGGGLQIVNCDSLTIENCLISANSAAADGGGLSCIYYASPSVVRCTLYDNWASNFGGGIHISTADPLIANTILSGNQGNGGGIYFAGAAGTGISYADFYDNSGGNFQGDVPPGLGEIVSVNANGDSCDIFFNIFEDPAFVDTAWNDYRLQWGSPCIDAGDPSSELDPDGSIADMGAFYFDQSKPVRILLTPHNAPIEIPAQGGSFDYTIQLTNIDSVSHPVRLWCDVTLPSGSTFGPVLGPVVVDLGSETTISRERTQMVPGGAPGGTYSYNASAVAGTDTSSDSFPVVKLGPAGPGISSGWTNFGEDVVFNATSNPAPLKPATFTLHPCYPNPFNPTTTISFTLPVASWVKLEVYDIAGRSVGAVRELPLQLVNGWREAGTHKVTFDGSELASGVYIYRLTVMKPAGTGAIPTTASGKMVLMK